MNSTHKSNKKKLHISFRLGFREFLGVLLCLVVFFAGPIGIIEYNKLSSPGNSETYTRAANEEVQGEGRVAGVTTQSATGNKYFTVPILNFRFDTTLSEKSSIVFLFGAMLLAGGIILGLSLVVSSNKKMVINRD